MALDASDITAIAADISATVEGIAVVIPDGSTVEDQIEVVGPRLLAEMQVQLRQRYGTLDSPLPDDLRHLLTTGCIAELLLLGYRNLEEGEQAWPDEWRRRFETGLAGLAAGVDQIDDPAPTGRFATASTTRQFTVTAFDAVL